MNITELPSNAIPKARELAKLRNACHAARRTQVYGRGVRSGVANNYLGVIGEMLHATHFGIPYSEIRVDRPWGDGGWDFEQWGLKVDVKYADYASGPRVRLFVSSIQLPLSCDVRFLWRVASKSESGQRMSGKEWSFQRHRWGVCAGWITAEKFQKKALPYSAGSSGGGEGMHLHSRILSPISDVADLQQRTLLPERT